MEKPKIYLSYHPDDNRSADEKDRGWVDNFVQLLNMMYTQLYDDEIIFCNTQGTDGLVKTRPGNADAALLILSPNFLEDPDCKEEMKQITSSLDGHLLFKAIKFPITDYPLNGLADLTNYNFYSLDRASGEAKTYQNLIDTNLEGSVWMKVMDLAEAVHTVLNPLENGSKNEKTNSKVNIYLADTGNLLSIERNIIRRELSRYGFNVSPKGSIPKDESKAKKLIEKELKECQLSIHLIDNKQYIGKDNSHWELAMIQNEIARQKFEGGASGKLSRLIWIPQVEEDEESGFEGTSDELEFTKDAEVLQSSIEDLKNVLKNNLVLQSEELGETTSVSGNGKSKIYLIYDQANQNEIHGEIEKLKGLGYDVLLPSFDNNLLAVRDQHISSLKACDMAMIYYHSSDAIWLRMKFLDLVKSPGLGRTKGQMPKIILHEKGQTFQKEFFEKHNSIFQEIGGSYDFLKEVKTKSPE